MRPTASCLVLRCAFVFVTCHFGSSAKTNKHQERKVEGSACLAIEQAEFTRAEDVSVANLPGERSSKRPSFRPASFMQAPAEACTRVPYLLSSEYNSMPVHRISKVSANGLRGAKYDGMNHRKLFEGSLSASEALRVPP